jgi:hypothetical protein
MARELAFARTREPDATRRKAEVGKRHRRVAKRHRLPRYRRSGPRGRDTITENGLRMDGGGGGVSSVSRSAAVRRNHAPSLATIPLRKENSRSFFLTTEPRPPTIARAHHAETSSVLHIRAMRVFHGGRAWNYWGNHRTWFHLDDETRSG